MELLMLKVALVLVSFTLPDWTGALGFLTAAPAAEALGKLEEVCTQGWAVDPLPMGQPVGQPDLATQWSESSSAPMGRAMDSSAMRAAQDLKSAWHGMGPLAHGLMGQ